MSEVENQLASTYGRVVLSKNRGTMIGLLHNSTWASSSSSSSFYIIFFTSFCTLLQALWLWHPPPPSLTPSKSSLLVPLTWASAPGAPFLGLSPPTRPCSNASHRLPPPPQRPTMSPWVTAPRRASPSCLNVVLSWSCHPLGSLVSTVSWFAIDWMPHCSSSLCLLYPLLLKPYSSYWWFSSEFLDPL